MADSRVGIPVASASAPRRRYGAELNAALLESAWDELISVGYGRLTMASIAARASTSEAVLYRRWPNKDQMVLAAIEHNRAGHPIAEVDTGTLRDDLLAHLEAVAEARAGYYAIIAASSFAGLLADTGMSPEQIRDRLLGDQPASRDREIYRRAAERGEIELDRIPTPVLELPFELARLALVMDLKPPPTERIRSIVDDLFLPLVRANGGMR